MATKGKKSPNEVCVLGGGGTVAVWVGKEREKEIK